MTTQQIVRDSAGLYYLVQTLEQIEHAWLGIPVKKAGKRQIGAYSVPAWTAKKHATPRLIRKAGCTFVATVEAGSVGEA